MRGGAGHVVANDRNVGQQVRPGSAQGVRPASGFGLRQQNVAGVEVHARPAHRHDLADSQAGQYRRSNGGPAGRMHVRFRKRLAQRRDLPMAERPVAGFLSTPLNTPAWIVVRSASPIRIFTISLAANSRASFSATSLTLASVAKRCRPFASVYRNTNAREPPGVMRQPNPFSFVSHVRDGLVQVIEGYPDRHSIRCVDHDGVCSRIYQEIDRASDGQRRCLVCDSCSSGQCFAVDAQTSAGCLRIPSRDGPALGQLFPLPGQQRTFTVKASGHHHVYWNSASHGATRHAWRTKKGGLAPSFQV